MYCPVNVPPRADRAVAFLIANCRTPQERIDMRLCYAMLKQLLHFDPATLGTCLRPKPNRRIYLRGPLYVLHDLVFRNNRWEVDLVDVGKNPNWVR